jgi:hypothetical protein
MDVNFVVYCEKITTLNHTFATSTPWKETKELTKQGYKIIKSNRLTATLIKAEKINEPIIQYDGRYSRFERFKKLFESHVLHYTEWCKWELESNTLKNKQDIQSTLDVWDDMWADIIKDIANDERIKDKEEQDLENTYETEQNQEFSRDRNWKHAFDMIDHHRTRYPINLGETLRDEMRDIFNYALTNDNIQIITNITID